MEENEVLKEAVEKLDTLCDDEEMQRLVDYRESIIYREKAIRRAGEIDGREEGIKIGKLETAKKCYKKVFL